MTDGEILRSYKEAKNPNAQIKVLADLNGCRPAEIVNILVGQGVDIAAPSVKRPKTSSQYADKLQALYDQGLSDKAMAYGVGCSIATVAKYRKANKLPPNEPEGGDKRFADTQEKTVPKNKDQPVAKACHPSESEALLAAYRLVLRDILRERE